MPTLWYSFKRGQVPNDQLLGTYVQPHLGFAMWWIEVEANWIFSVVGNGVLVVENKVRR